MSRLSVKLAYDKKIAEIHDLFEKENKKFQDLIEKKDRAILELEETKQRKATLGGLLVNLDSRIKEKKEEFDGLREKERKFVSSVKQELKQEESSLKKAKENLDQTTDDIDEMTKIAIELREFLNKESDARIRYLEAQEKLNISERKYLIFQSKTEKEKEDLIIKNKEFDVYKEYLKDLYGRLASYVVVAKETVDWVNEYFKKNKTPIHFDLPPGEILKINFDNFIEELKT